MVPFFVVTVIAVVLFDFLYLDKFEGVDFKYDISFFKLRSKILKKGFFGPNLRFFFCAKLFILINSRVLISNMVIIVLNLQPKFIQIRHFWYQV